MHSIRRLPCNKSRLCALQKPLATKNFGDERRRLTSRMAPLGVADNDKLTLKEWRGDKSLPGIYPEGNSNPDLVLEHDCKPFAIECKWRSHLPKDIDKVLLPPARVALFIQYSQKNNLPVYLLLGIGGQPTDPDILYLTPFTPKLTATDILKAEIQANQLIDSIISRFPKPSPPKISHMQQEKLKHHNAYARWSEDDDTHLRQLFIEGKTVKELMTVFERNRGGITFRLRKLNLI